jgi:hypothetical protein
MMTDEPRESTYIIQPSAWQAAAFGVAVTVFVFCLLCGVLLWRVNGLVNAGLKAQNSCYEVVKK